MEHEGMADHEDTLVLECEDCGKLLTVPGDDVAPWVVVEQAEELGWFESVWGWFCPACQPR